VSDGKKITGGCLCGAVRYEVSQTPDEDIGYCHCRMCQKALGGLFGCFVIFTGAEKANTFQFILGAPKLYKSSARAERGFCAECGTPLLFRDSKAIAVTLGSLDHPEEFPPKSHSGIESQVPWLTIDNGLPRWKTVDDPYVIRAEKPAHKNGK